LIDGNRIRALRVEQGFSQEELADHAGIRPTMMGYIERGVKTTTADVLKRIADKLGCTVDSLLRDTEATA